MKRDMKGMKGVLMLFTLHLLGTSGGEHLVRKPRKNLDIFSNGLHELPTTTTTTISTSKSKKSKKTPKLNCVVKHKKKGSASKKTSTPTASPAPTSSTYAPTYSGKGKGGEDCPTMWSACSLLEMGQAEFDTFNYVVDMKLAITDPEVSNVLEALQDYLEDELNQALSGCYDFDVRRRRRLQETGIMKIEVDVSEDPTTDCTQTSTGQTCDVDIGLEVTHDEGDADLIRTTLLNTIMSHCTAIKELPGVDNVLDPCASISISGEETTDGSGSSPSTGNGDSDGGTTDSGDLTGGDGDGTTQGDGETDEDDGGDAAAVVQTRSSQEKVQARGYVSIAVSAALVLLLLLLLAARKRKYASAMQHKYLEDDGGDDETETYLRDSDTDSQDVQPRQVHIVGEADSVFSGWTGFTGDRRTNSKDHGGLYPDDYNGSYDESYMNQDVHRCASATCEVCERNRRAGIQFIPSRMPSHSSTIMPFNAERHYATEDTVVL